MATNYSEPDAPEFDELDDEPVQRQDPSTPGARRGYTASATAAPEPMPHVEHSFSPSSFVCVRCGSRNLADGYIIDFGDKFEQVHFAPKRVTLRWLNSFFALRPWKSLAKLDAVACRDCGAVLLTVAPDELRRAERRREAK